ncbi:methyltransferase domain-containing protein [Amycolatopsis sp. OK19-0408]|uniref:Methyltransferase domain-containing protein n=1 Tax=Amycolatopsis iheyensis TaxID=2945988 RepID=A0A9X2NGS9_9PSEU|nr:class I SAM-dependent methyltransferase [Amycolatopsis iheyensis]MCR6487512.1 methyltransferase domain-containing protein [Amycolatopsis iheyensis]
MTHDFDQPYWEQHWRQAPRHAAGAPNPHLVRETADLPPGTALDAGCGRGAEARWLATRGWAVTAVDIAAEALDDAPGVRWVRADLTTWTPGTAFELVTTHYAHPSMPQLAFYDRVAGWVAPGGTLLIVGHGGQHAHAPVTPEAVTARLDPSAWTVVTAAEHVREVPGRSVPLHDVVVRARRRGGIDRPER